MNIYLSVIVPIYKGNCYIDGILTMIEANVQEIKRFRQDIEIELLFVNDFPDMPIETRRFSAKLPFKVRVVCNQRNLGIHGSRVQGLKESKGDYILFLDQDDKISNEWMRSQLSSIGTADVCVGNGYKVYSDCRKVIYRNIKKHSLATKEKIFLKAACQIVSPGHCLIRREAIPLDWINNIVAYNGSDDIFLWILMFEQKKQFCINSERIYEHIDTGRNVSRDSNGMAKSAYNVMQLMRSCGSVLDKHVRIYERRVKFSEDIQRCQGLKKILLYLKNIDICLWKVYAYYR